MINKQRTLLLIAVFLTAGCLIVMLFSAWELQNPSTWRSKVSSITCSLPNKHPEADCMLKEDIFGWNIVPGFMNPHQKRIWDRETLMPAYRNMVRNRIALIRITQTSISNLFVLPPFSGLPVPPKAPPGQAEQWSAHRCSGNRVILRARLCGLLPDLHGGPLRARGGAQPIHLPSKGSEGVRRGHEPVLLWGVYGGLHVRKEPLGVWCLLVMLANCGSIC